LFGKRIRAQDIALKLARAVDDTLITSDNDDPRPVAPDRFLITLNPENHQVLLQKHPDLADKLCNYLIELATNADYQLAGKPQLKILPDEIVEENKLTVVASHSNATNEATAAMQPVNLPPAHQPQNAHLVINNTKTIALSQPLVNIGRNSDNHIVLDDPYASRHHAQIRLRFGTYLLFNAQSKTGTFVNGVEIKEHPLKSGDVIHIGRTQIVYLQDPADDTGDVTAAFDPF
jgi:hypothetical protein